MAQKSTRARIKWQADKIQSQLDRCLVHLKSIDELSQGRSDYINDWLPALTNMFDTQKSFIEDFQKGL